MKSTSILYSALTLGLVAVAVLTHASEARHFVSYWQLWYEPVIAGGVCGGLCALLGLYMLWNRIVFVSLAMTQGAGVGIFLSFLIASWWGVSLEDSSWSLLMGCVVSALTAFLFVSFRKNRRHADEVLIGLMYVIAAGLIVVIGDHIAEGKHAIDNLLFGNAVAVTSASLQRLVMVSVGIGIIHVFFRREFLYASADAEFMHISGLKVDRWLVVLYLTFTVGITIAMKTIGSLPAFAVMVIPPFLALRSARAPRAAVVVAVALGALIPPLGYFFSFLYALPTGASIIMVGGVYILGGWLYARCRAVTSRDAPAKYLSQ